ncbi:hypothetical protein Taro_031437 [Colocasia esculenta]|uniref:Secreted protein n=1 Tax=Colocasia esculenta TaxID=4460 RepID=A0A843W351_COLES|nr:hypothetical protein [Colocasia esculenta]
MVVTLLCVASWSRPARASRHGCDSSLRRDPDREIVLGSLLREYSGLRVCSSWQPPGGLRSLGENGGETSQQWQGTRRAEETGQ